MNSGRNCLHFTSALWTTARSYLCASILAPPNVLRVITLKCKSDPVSLLFKTSNNFFSFQDQVQFSTRAIRAKSPVFFSFTACISTGSFIMWLHVPPPPTCSFILKNLTVASLENLTDSAKSELNAFSHCLHIPLFTAHGSSHIKLLS